MTEAIKQSRIGQVKEIALGAVVYASLIAAYNVYSITVGVGSLFWLACDTLIAFAFGWFGFWQLSRGAGLRQTVLLVSFLHFAVRLGPIMVSGWNDPGRPDYVYPTVIVVWIVVTSAWFLFSRAVARYVTS